MACRNAYRTRMLMEEEKEEKIVFSSAALTEPKVAKKVDRLLFGVDSSFKSDDHLQNNLDQFEWVVRNKIYPNFYGRNLTGENALTKKEIDFIHRKGCQILLYFSSAEGKETETQGRVLAKQIGIKAIELGIKEGTAIFLEIGEKEPVKKKFLLAFAKEMLVEGFTPGFKANTDAKFEFDREFSRGIQNDNEIFKKCLIWAVSPVIKEYDEMMTTHLIHPDNWEPYAPSGISRDAIAVWQYGRNCHKIENDSRVETSFNLDLVRNEQVIIDKMF